MFTSFRLSKAKCRDVEINYRIGGNGPPLMLLHGYPQSHVIWHKIAEQLAEKFTVVASDLRGYGDSSKPTSDNSHSIYSKRAMGDDQVSLMRSLGFDQFYLAGHDRGGRVGHRMALDYPTAIMKLIVMDIAPTYTMYKSTDFEFAQAYYHWFFLIQKHDLPEKLIEKDPLFYLQKKLGQWADDEGAFTKSAFAEYERCFNKETIHASCEDYRASASIDLEHDQIDLDNNKKIIAPMLCLWGNKGFVGNKYDVVTEWKKWATNVNGFGLDCGHYLPEEAPERTLKAILQFLS